MILLQTLSHIIYYYQYHLRNLYLIQHFWNQILLITAIDKTYILGTRPRKSCPFFNTFLNKILSSSCDLFSWLISARDKTFSFLIDTVLSNLIYFFFIFISLIQFESNFFGAFFCNRIIAHFPNGKQCSQYGESGEEQS